MILRKCTKCGVNYGGKSESHQCPIEPVTIYQQYVQLETENASLQSRLTQAEEILKKIREHKHCDPKYIFEHPDECRNDGSDKYWFADDMGRANGHRCAAAIATAYFRGK